jgi:DNA-binding CsgD family transcriptional regulator
LIGISRRLIGVGEQVLSAGGGDMSEDMDPRLFTECLREVSSVSALWLLVQRFSKAQDFRTITYHSIDVQSLGDSSFGAVAIGIPAEFHRMYTEEHLYLDDPFPPFAASQITPFFWRDLPQLTTLTEKQKAYLNRAREFGFADGLVCQVFGPQARNALVSIGFHHDRPRPTDAEVLDLHVASQFAHMRFCALVAGPAAPNRRLSPRELELLRWIARGKSNTSIAQIMGVSRHTVDTIMRRLFGKLDVTDRTRAAVRGLAFGLIDPSLDNLS